MPIGKMTPYIFYSYMDCVVAYLEMASHCMLLKANVPCHPEALDSSPCQKQN